MSRTVITILGAEADRAVEDALSGLAGTVTAYIRVRTGVAAERELCAANWPVALVDPELLSTSELLSVSAACLKSNAALVAIPSIGTIGSERTSLLLRGGLGGQLAPEVARAKPVVRALIRKLPDRLVSDSVSQGLGSRIELLADGVRDFARAAITAPWIPYSELLSRAGSCSRRTVSRAFATAGLASLRRLHRAGSLALAWELLSPREGETRASVARLSGLGSVRSLNHAFDEVFGEAPRRVREGLSEIRFSHQLLLMCNEPGRDRPMQDPE